MSNQPEKYRMMPHFLFSADSITEFIIQTFFDQPDRLRFATPETANPQAFRHYTPDESVLGKRMKKHVGDWPNACWNGADMLGAGSFERPSRQPPLLFIAITLGTWVSNAD